MFGFGWGPASWTIVSEIFPLSIRSKGASIGASSNWVNNFAIAFLVPPMFKHASFGTYIFFACMLAGGFFWVLFCLPETRNATLEDMDRVFKSRTGAADQAMLAEARREVGLDDAIEEIAVAAVSEKVEHVGAADVVEKV
jgi:MFS family permease